MQYLKNIWRARHFWIHLVRSDLRSKWRRSFFGVLWSVLQPLGLTILISFVFGKVFGSPIHEYAPYVLSGIIVWDFFTLSINGGALAFVQADLYIKQCKHPLAIYSLRTVLLNLAVMVIASISLFFWVIFFLPGTFNVTWLSLFYVAPVFLLIAWPAATLIAYLGAKYRDIPHMLGLFLQSLWFMSPVYFEIGMFRTAGLDLLVDYNPIYHMLELVRAPLLRGDWPTIDNYVFCGATSLVLILLVLLVGLRNEKKIIFYL